MNEVGKICRKMAIFKHEDFVIECFTITFNILNKNVINYLF